MVAQKLDIIDKDVAAASDVLKTSEHTEKASEIGSAQTFEPIVVAFDRGDAENSGNWPKVCSFLTSMTVFLITCAAQEVNDGFHRTVARYQHYDRLVTA